MNTAKSKVERLLFFFIFSYAIVGVLLLRIAYLRVMALALVPPIVEACPCQR